MNKQISVIIPNYNYSRFLHRRISTVVNQTVKPAEIIFLDDCSTDDSLIVADELLRNQNIPYRIISNKSNQGVFKQWVKGIELTVHDYFWIAEADDYCELNLIEELLQAFNDKDVVISFCKSRFVDINGSIICDERDYKSQYLNALRWDNDFVNSQDDEIVNYLSVINTIPNVSAVLFNKLNINCSIVLKQVGEYYKSGDWLFYILALASNNSNKISYSSLQLNYYVRHEQSVYISNYTKSGLFKELLEIYLYIIQNYCLTSVLKDKIFNRVYELFVWYDYAEENVKLLEILQRYLDGNIFLEKLLTDRKSLINNLYESNQDLHGVNVELSRVNDEWLKVNNELSRVNDELSRVNDEWHKVNNELSRVNDELSRVNDEWHKVNNELSRVNDELSRVNDEWLKVNNELSRVNNEWSILNKELTIISEEYQQKSVEFNSLQNQYNSMLDSYSWRVTRPFRRVMNLIRVKRVK